jgi:uncharacterized protein
MTHTTDTSYFAILHGENYMSLTTFRKNGDAVSTPVWFAQDGGRLVMLTFEKAGKVKRLRHNNTVEVAPCDVRGKVKGDKVTAKARFLSSEEGKKANQLLSRKYGIQKRLFGLMNMFSKQQPIFLEITPA